MRAKIALWCTNQAKRKAKQTVAERFLVKRVKPMEASRVKLLLQVAPINVS